MSFIHESAKIVDSSVEDIKVYRDVIIKNCNIGSGCSVGDDSTIERCEFENNVVVNRRSYVNDSFVGCFTYMGINTTMNWTKIGKFCSIARNVDIGGFDHDYHKVTTMPLFRYEQSRNGGGNIPNIVEHTQYCEIGNDVWIAAGAQILHKVKIGDGAVIGGGAVVTKDVPPYAIVAGVPARVIGYRCSEENIRSLEQIKWWNWPQHCLDKYMSELINRDISDDVIDWMLDISHSLKGDEDRQTRTKWKSIFGY